MLLASPLAEAFAPLTSLRTPHTRSTDIGRGLPHNHQFHSESTADSRSLCKLHLGSARVSMHPHANLAVTIDQPLLPSANSKFAKSALAFLMSDVVKAAMAAFLLAMVLTILVRSSGSFIKVFRGFTKMIQKVMAGVSKFVKGTLLRVTDRLKQPNRDGVPMSFDDTENDGWGVCTLRSKKRLGRTSFVQYEFDLPKSNQVLPLKLGQQAALCCLDNTGSVAKADFYVYHPQVNAMMGRFSIVAPNKGSLDNEYDVGGDAANFVRVLKNDLKVGDEIAVKPGDRKLEYRGQHFPVTDMVYIASGVGIVPILEQVRAVLPNGSSSVKSVTVVWIDENADDFDVISDHLEREYYKYTTKLAVSCVVDNMRVNTLADNYSIVNAIPEFIPGTMAVLSGARPVQRKAANYLVSRGYPQDSICEL
eukprot:CAMPEP_0119022186 /NCGR_PEP_ID=MMETSP1176-20130426/27454_1 /TAXON_ID=265551 /ORGANISM="Synedropsis recta cf, Strain CCMP1620" /LENGTH=419 /DNA_ID=CAMNT_0006976949 /DNA_START=149 /DNA_END=1408 /DNA_ORIENTATION=+